MNLLRQLLSRRAACATFTFACSTGVFVASGSKTQSDELPIYDVVVIGAGVVGLATAAQCAKAGFSVKVLEREPVVGAMTSAGNSGLGCTGYDAPVGSLERLLLRRSILLHRPLLRSLGLSHDGGHVRKCGSLVVAWTDEEAAALPTVLADNRAAGDSDARLLTADELHRLEPRLAPHARGAVLCPYEAIVEPSLVVAAHHEDAVRSGADIATSREVCAATYDARRAVWSVTTRSLTSRSAPHRSADGALLVPRDDPAECRSPLPWTNSTGSAAEDVKARVVVNASGIFGDAVETLRVRGRGVRHTLGADAETAEVLDRLPWISADAVPSDTAPVAAYHNTNKGDDGSDPLGISPFRIRPRKGQFVVLSPPPTVQPSDLFLEHIIEPVPSQHSKGVIIWQTLWGNIIVGPTADDIESRRDRSTDQTTVDSLLATARQRIPELSSLKVAGTYACLRPGSDRRDYAIGTRILDNWITLGGIRSTGLTAAPAIGEYARESATGLLEALAHRKTCDTCSTSWNRAVMDPTQLVVSARASLQNDKIPSPESCSRWSEDPAGVRISHSALHCGDGVGGVAVSSAAACVSELPVEQLAATSQLVPNLKAMAAEFRDRADGCVTLYGRPWAVMHPISSFGMQSIL